MLHKGSFIHTATLTLILVLSIPLNASAQFLTGTYSVNDTNGGGHGTVEIFDGNKWRAGNGAHGYFGPSSTPNVFNIYVEGTGLSTGGEVVPLDDDAFLTTFYDLPSSMPSSYEVVRRTSMFTPLNSERGTISNQGTFANASHSFRGFNRMSAFTNSSLQYRFLRAAITLGNCPWRTNNPFTALYMTKLGMCDVPRRPVPDPIVPF